MLKLASPLAAAAMAVFLSAPASAAMLPATPSASPSVVHVDCAIGFHIGPAGACIIGNDAPRDGVVRERRATDEGCETKSVKRTDGNGDSETRTATNCN